MPNKEIQKLNEGSESPQAKAALSSCIADEINNGVEPDQAKAMCYSMIKEKTGKEL